MNIPKFLFIAIILILALNSLSFSQEKDDNDKTLNSAYVIDVTLEKVKIKLPSPKSQLSYEDVKDIPYSENDYSDWKNSNYEDRLDIVMLVGIGEKKEYMRFLGCRLPELMSKKISAEALYFVKSRLAHKFIRFYQDITERDEEGRVLAYVYYAQNNNMMNSKLLEYGFCQFDETYPCRFQVQFLTLSNYHRVMDCYIDFVVKMDWLIFNGNNSEAGKLYQNEEINTKAEQDFFSIINSSPILYLEYYQKLELRRKQIGLINP